MAVGKELNAMAKRIVNSNNAFDAELENGKDVTLESCNFGFNEYEEEEEDDEREVGPDREQVVDQEDACPESILLDDDEEKEEDDSDPNSDAAIYQGFMDRLSADDVLPVWTPGLVSTSF